PGDNHRNAGAQTVHVVDQVERIRYSDDPQKAEQYIDPLQGSCTEDHAVRDQDNGRRSLASEFEHRPQLHAVVKKAQQGNECGAGGDVPVLTQVKVEIATSG